MVDGLWSGDDANMAFDRLQMCPQGTSTPIQAIGPDRYEAVRQAIIRSLSGYVYGFTPDLEYRRVIEVRRRPGCEGGVGRCGVGLQASPLAWSTGR